MIKMKNKILIKKFSKGEELSKDEISKLFPCLETKLIPIEKIQFNEYNPNAVAPPEMKLLQKSIEEDGYTQPIVTFYDKERDQYIVVDGAHRFINASQKFKIPFAPVVVIDKDLNDRIASTIRHNRARGTHDIDLMSKIVSNLVDSGMSDTWISKKLGMDADELLRMKQISGLASLFKDREFSKSWE